MRKPGFYIVPVASSAALALFYYAAASPFRFIFLECGGHAVIRDVGAGVERRAAVFFLACLPAMAAASAMLRRRGLNALPLLYLALPGLFALSFLPAAARFPEFIPMAAVFLPAAGFAAFAVSVAGGGAGNPREKPPREAWVFAVFAVFFLLFSASGYRLNEAAGYHSGDEGHYLTMAGSIARDFDIDIRNQVPGYTDSMRGHLHISPRAREGRGYSWHSPGLSFVLAPFYRLSEGSAAKRGALFVLYLLGAFLGTQVYLAAMDSSGSHKAGLFAAGALMLSSPLWIYSIRAYPMVPGGLCILYCWRRLKDFSSSRGVFLLFSLLLAWLPWLHDTFLIAYGLLAGAVFWRWFKAPRDTRPAAAAAMQAANILLFVFFRLRWFGPAFFAQPGGVLDFWPGLFAAWLDYFRGMAFASPVNLLGFVLIWAYALKKKDAASVLLLILYLAVYVPGSSSGLHWTGGSCHPGRRLAPVIPLAAAPLAYFLTEKRRLSLLWLAAFSGILSAGYMAYFAVLNPLGFIRPLSSLALSEPLFRPLNLHLPDFGQGFGGFPWGHFLFAASAAGALVFSWFRLAAGEKTPSEGRLRSGMAVTAAFVFVPVWLMRTLFSATPPFEYGPRANFAGNAMRLSEPLDRDAVFLYALGGEGRGFEYAVTGEGLPCGVDLSRGVYELRLEGGAPPGARAEAEVLHIRGRVPLGRFTAAADDEGRVRVRKRLWMPSDSGRVSVFLGAPGFEIGGFMIKPVPPWLEELSGRIRRVHARSGVLRYVRRPPEPGEPAIPPAGFRLSSPARRDALGNMLDGSPLTRWKTNAPQSPGMFFEIDMGDVYSVSGVRLSQGRFWYDWPRGLDVFASRRGGEWTRVYSQGLPAGYVYESAGGPCLHGGENSVTFLFGPVEAGRLRLELVRGDPFFDWSVAGLEVLGKKFD